MSKKVDSGVVLKSGDKVTLIVDGNVSGFGINTVLLERDNPKA